MNAFTVMKQLPQVELIAISSVQMRRTVAALQQSMQGLFFGKVKLLSDKKPSFHDRKIEVIPISPIHSADDYSRFVLLELAKYVDLPHCLIVQADGYVVRPESWSDQFLQYDYIGAPWPDQDLAFVDAQRHYQRVGNGGFSLRSKRLLALTSECASKDPTLFQPGGQGRSLFEDVKICVEYRSELEKHGCVFAAVDVAARFSTERHLPDSRPDISFGFHGIHPYRVGWSKTDWFKGWSFPP
jgi:hypothetical protein